MMLRTGIRITAALALAAPALVAIVPGTAAAYPQVCRPQEKWASVSEIKYYRTPTHLEGRSIAPYAEWSRTVSVGVDATYSAGIDLTAEASAKAGVIFAKAEATIGAKLSVAGSVTTKKAVSETWTFKNGSGHQRRYVIWSGVMRYTGQYSYHVCNSSGRAYSTSTGKWRSHRVRWHGTSLCGYPYKSGTMEYNANRLAC